MDGMERQAMLVACVLLEGAKNVGVDLPPKIQAKLDANERGHADDTGHERKLLRK
jgi:hypothetical protein